MMNPAVMIKMCGITRVNDGLDAVKAGANYLGYVFYAPSPRYITPHAAADIICKIRNEYDDSVKHVGLFVNEPIENALEIIKVADLDVLQLHGNETLDYCQHIAALTDLPYWKAIHVSPNTQADELLKSCLHYSSAQALLFDTASELWGGTGQTFEWQKLLNLDFQHSAPHLVLSGGLNAQNVSTGIKTLNPWMVDVSSAIEAQDTLGKPVKGVKSIEKMMTFANAVHSVNASKF